MCIDINIVQIYIHFYCVCIFKLLFSTRSIVTTWNVQETQLQAFESVSCQKVLSTTSKNEYRKKDSFYPGFMNPSHKKILVAAETETET